MSKQHGEWLTEDLIKEGGYAVNHGGYGSRISLGEGKSFASKWQPLEDTDLYNTRQPFRGLKITIDDSISAQDRNVVESFIRKNGGELASGANVDLWIFAAGASEPRAAIASQALGVELGYLCTTFPRLANAMGKALPDDQKPAKPRKVTLTPEEVIEFDQIRKLLASSVPSEINQGLLKARDHSEKLDCLIGDLKLKDGQLSQAGAYSKIGSDEHREFVVYNLLSLAPAHSKGDIIKKGILSIELKKRGKLIPVFCGYDKLESLSYGCDQREQAEGTREAIDQAFQLGNDFSRCSPFQELTGLVAFHPLQTLKHLQAPKLKRLTVNGGKLSTLEQEVPPSVEHLNIKGLNSACSLEGLRDNLHLKQLYLSSSDESLDVLFIDQIKSLNEVEVSGVRRIPDSWPNGLSSIKVSRSAAESLGKLPASLRKLVLEDCSAIHSLEGIGHANMLESVELLSCSSLTDISGLAQCKSITSLLFKSCDQLVDISALEELDCLESCEIWGPVAKPPSTWPQVLKSLRLQGWTAMSVGQLPPSLEHLYHKDDIAVENLDDFRLCDRLFDDECYRYGIGSLDLSGFKRLVSLRGIENCEKLLKIVLPASPVDATPLANRSDVTFLVEIGDSVESVAPVIESLACIPRLKLALNDGWCPSRNDLKDLRFLSPLFKCLISLDLTKVSDLLSLDEVIQMDNLCELKINGSSDNPAMSFAKKARFTSKGQVDALKLRIMAGT